MKMKGTQFWLGGRGGRGGEGAEFQQTNYQSSHAPGFHLGGRDVEASN